MNLKRVADILDTTFCNAGIFDDYDELIRDAFSCGGGEVGKEYHLNVLEGLKFMNQFQDADKQYDLNKWHEDYIDACDRCGYPEFKFDLEEMVQINR